MIKWNFVLALMFFLQIALNAQEKVTPKDTLCYLNGEKELIYDYKIDKDKKILNYFNHKSKSREVETDFIYSINKADGTVEVMYKPSDNEEDTLTIEEMRFFVLGGQKARKNCKAHIALLDGFVVGMASPFIVASVGLNPFYSPILPAVNTTIIGLLKPSEKNIKKAFPELSKHSIFIEGYQEAGRQKRVKRSITGALVGILTGIAVVIIL